MEIKETTQKDFSKQLEQQIQKEIQEAKENPKKAILDFLWAITWYAIIITIILYLTTIPYTCKTQDKQYNIYQFQKGQQEINQQTQENPYKQIPIKCNYDITRYAKTQSYKAWWEPN